jgi:vitamin B12 transporter
VVVTASKTVETVREVTSNITIIEPEAIQESSAIDIGQLLAQQGFQVVGANAGGHTLSLRGVSQTAVWSGGEMASRVLVLYNGRRIITNGMDFTGMANIERIEIIRGSAALQYGPSALGGVVNIITKRGGEIPSIYLEAGGGSNGLGKGKAAFSGSIGGFDFSLAGVYATSDDYETSKGWTWEHTATGENLSTSVDLGYTISGLHRIGVNYYYVRIRHDECPAQEVSLFNPQPTFGGFSWHNLYVSNVAISYEGRTENRLFNWFANYGTGRHNDQANWGSNVFDIDTFTGVFSYNGNLITANTGVDYSKYRTVSSTSGNVMSDLGFHLAGKLHLLDGSLIFSAGARYDSYSIEGIGMSLTQDANNIVPSVGVAYSPFDWLKLRANYSKGFMMPTPGQINGGSGILPNLDLDPEESVTWEIGADLAWKYLAGSLTYFQTEYTDRIISMPVPGSYNPDTQGPWSRYTNLKGVITSGIELSLSADLGMAFNQNFVLRPYLNYSYLTKLENKDYSGGSNSVQVLGYNKVPSIYKLTFAAGVYFNHDDVGLSANINVRKNGNGFMGNYSDFPWPVGPVYMCYSNAAIVDLSVQKKLVDFNDKGSLGLKVEINNLTNAYDLPYIGYPSPGRNFYVGVTYKY